MTTIDETPAYDYTDEQLDQMRDSAIEAALGALGLQMKDVFTSEPGNTADVWCRTASGQRVVVTVGIWNPADHT